MVEKLVEGLIGLLGGLGALPFGKQLIVFIISILPVLELRGGLIAAALLGLKPVESYIVSIIGNILPVPFILWLFNRIIEWMRTKKGLSKSFFSFSIFFFLF